MAHLEMEKLALSLMDIGAVKFGAFKLKLHEEHPEAPLSPIYIDLRTVRSFPDVMDLAVQVYKKLAEGLQFDVYADVPTAATPFVAVLSHLTRIPMISPRKTEKKYGTQAAIDGVFQAGQVALVIDDLITNAGSKLEAISALEEKGLKVQDVVVLIDREQGGTNELVSRGYHCHAGLHIRELIEIYLQVGKITHEQYDRTLAYLSS